MNMATHEIRDWLAARQGWTKTTVDGYTTWQRKCPPEVAASPANFRRTHPFPSTLDGADESFPPNWIWQRYMVPNDGMRWVATKSTAGSYRFVADTGDKIHDLYALSRLAWEQEKQS